MFSRGTWSSKLSVETLVCLLDDVFSRFDNGSSSDAIVIDEFFRLSAVRDGSHRKLMHADPFSSDSIEHGIAQPTMCIVVFNRKNPVLCIPSAFQQSGSVDGNDAVEIDDACGNAGRLQLIIGFERFE